MGFDFGLLELLPILVIASTLPTEQEPLPVETVMAGVPNDCNIFMFQDMRDVQGRLDSLSAQLLTQEWFTNSVELSAEMEHAQVEFAAFGQEFEAQIGANPLTDLTSFSLCLSAVQREGLPPKPSFLMVFQGNFEPLENLELLTSRSTVGPAVPDSEMSPAFVQGPNVLYFGSDDRIGALEGQVPSFDPAAFDENRMSAVRDAASSGVTSMFFFEPSAELRSVLDDGGPDSSWNHFLNGIEAGLLAMDEDTVYLATWATDNEAFEDHRLILSGLGQIARAFPAGAFGMAQLVFGVLSADDTEIDRDFRAILPYRDQILSFVQEMGLDRVPSHNLGQEV
ncbi:MAG: hypothetical protein KC561_20935, partial [Myxococcales bacterium]|nr:hypothetical protein [Myxococcales bacterium]